MARSISLTTCCSICITVSQAKITLSISRAIPSYLDTLIGNADFYGGIEPKVGTKNLRVIALDGFPQESYPGILAALDELAIEYRWSTRYQFLDPFTARPLIDSVRKKWKQKDSRF